MPTISYFGRFDSQNFNQTSQCAVPAKFRSEAAVQPRFSYQIGLAWITILRPTFQIALCVYSDLFKRSVVCVTLRLLAGWQHLGRQTSCSNDAINRTEDSDQRNDCIWNGSLCSQPIMQKTDVRHWPTVPWRPISQFSLIHLNPYKLFISCTFHRWQQKYPMGFPGKKTWRKKSKENESFDFTNAERL